MARSKPSVAWLRLALLFLAPLTVDCASAPPAEEPFPPKVTEVDLLTRTAPEPGSVLSFPPADEARTPRRDLPDGIESTGQSSAPEVRSPSLDSEGAFKVAGQEIVIGFSQRMDVAKKDAQVAMPAPALPTAVRLLPEVAGKARWLDDTHLSFVADAPFDETKPYAITVSDVSSARGKPIAAPWKATFRATPSVTVAGKVLGYIPAKGRQRVIAVHPSGYGDIGSTESLSVLYDQPIDLSLARTLIELRDKRGASLPFLVDHPGGQSFQGVKVDPKLVVLIRPKRPLPGGETVELIAKNRAKEDSARDRSVSLSVADRLEFSGVACGYGSWDDGEACSFESGRLHMSGQTLHVRFSNPIDTPYESLAAHVQVTPRVPNLRVHTEGWDGGRLILRGGFEPSKNYDVFIAGLTDRFGGKQAGAVQFKIAMRPVGASIQMPEGVLALDETMTRALTLTSRNVAEAELVGWHVEPKSGEAWDDAASRARSRDLPERAPDVRIPLKIRAIRDQLVETTVDLTKVLTAGDSYLTTVRPTQLAFDAEAMGFPRGSEAAAPSVALLQTFSPNAIAAHVRSLPSATLVQVARLGSGEPVLGASVRFDDESASAVKTDADGVAFLMGKAGSRVFVDAGGATAWVALDRNTTSAEHLFPDLATGEEEGPSSGRRAMIMSDRGIYRPGSTIQIKASVRVASGAELAPESGKSVRIRVVGPTGEDVLSELVTTNDRGSVATKLELATGATLGRHQLRVEDPEQSEPPLARSILQVAEFEPPRFAVDVDASEGGDGKLNAKVHGRYLFGAPMEGAAVAWTLSRTAAAFPKGPLTAAGLVFRREARWYDDEEETAPFTRAATATLGKDGALAIEQPLPMDDAVGPQSFTLEADVTDSSMRHIASRASVIKHGATRYAGVRAPSSWIGAGEPFEVELGAIDTSGRSIVNAAMSATLHRIDWHYGKRRASGGAVRWEWSATRTEVDRCQVKSAQNPVKCSLRAPTSGSYEIVADAEGAKGGATTVWAWREGDKATAMPSRGNAIEVVTSKTEYAPGETAKLLVQNPYAAATAILTIEQGGLVSEQHKRVTGGAAVFEVPIEASHAPFVNATVTLLPIDPKAGAAAGYRLGATRIGVTLEGVRLAVAVRSDKAKYLPGEDATIEVEVKDGGAAVAGAEIALAIVDEGVLRLTNFHAPDPAVAMRPGRALSFRVADTRDGLAELRQRSHIAGDGGGEGGQTIAQTRKNFVQTALWKPDLRTDAAGRATVSLKLPDNLTEFRIWAVALDEKGKGGVTEGSFTVQKPVMLIPIVPRFAARGDRFEVAAMLHNNDVLPIDATVSLGDRKERIKVAAGSHARVAFPYVANAIGTQALSFSVADAAGQVRDQVVAKLPIDDAGYEDHPQLQGVFAREQSISLAIPEGITLRDDAVVRIQVGQRLWPELGARLEYLLGYPHGCVEQTTSSTLPLLAARAILPRIGMSTVSEAQLTARIRAGLERLASMRTQSGGLGYWPGDGEPNVYGTAYAMRAVVLARDAGIAAPSGLLDGMKSYLASELLDRATKPEVRAAIAQSLAELGELPASAADALYDQEGDQSVFGKASMAIALSTLAGQGDRVDALLDAVEASFDDEGKLTAPPRSDDFYYYGSPTRSRAQAGIALAKLRRGSRLLPPLMRDLSGGVESYTTQATAYSLLAVAEELRAATTDGADVRASLDGVEIEDARDLGFGSRELTLRAADLRGKKAMLKLTANGDEAIGFRVSAEWRRPITESDALTATRTEKSPDVYRVITDARGKPVDLSKIKAGDVLRVAVLAQMPTESVERDRLGYVAITDRLPGGFEPIQPDLASVATVPDLDDDHPFGWLLRWGSSDASHVELHDDRVNLYFDRVWGDHVAATYLVRASTPGEFVLPPASAELMYEAHSLGYSDAARVTIQ